MTTRTASCQCGQLRAFADPDFPPPEQSVRTMEKCAWLSLPDDVVQFADYPPRTPK